MRELERAVDIGRGDRRQNETLTMVAELLSTPLDVIICIVIMMMFSKTSTQNTK